MGTVRQAATNRKPPVPGTDVELATTNAVNHFVKAKAPLINAVVPAGFDSGRYGNLTITAIKTTPKLAACLATEDGQTSLMLAVVEAAALGLEPNTPLHECWLLPRNKKQGEKWITTAELAIGYEGYIKLAQAHGIKIAARAVRDGDEFEWYYGLEGDHLEHRPVSGNTGPVTHAYAVARFKDGSDPQFVVLSREDIDRRRSTSDSWKKDQKDRTSYSPWTNDEEAMARKSAVRELMKWIPKSPTLAAAAAVDERPLREGAGARVAAPDDTPQIAPASTAPAPAAAVVDGEEMVEWVDPATGEVTYYKPGEEPM